MASTIKESIHDVATKLSANYQEQGIFEMGIEERVPKKTEIIDLVNRLQRIMFPGFFGSENTAYVSLDNFAGSSLAMIYEKLDRQIRVALAYSDDTKTEAEVCDEAKRLTLTFLEKIPAIQAMLWKDVEAEFDGDPAANSKEEVIFCYPGMFAIFVYRIAHELYELRIPFIPRIMAEYAHSETGIDINPGAKIGEYFFIDHGTGIVIGETTVIGNHVKIYQGVTLGALSTQKGQGLSGVKRHPTIEDNVVIYANTTILGGETVVGQNSVIAGNTFVVSSIPRDTKVSANIPELQYKNRTGV